MGGFVAGGDDGRKIKGGRWTVFRFFLVSVAFTSAWLAVSSQLDYYRNLHGPQVLLQLNIAYYLPSIPLLAVSAFLDKPLEARLGVARTILVRLLVGLLGYGAVAAWLPFSPPSIWFLLGAVVALGLFSGIAFSASYQLVARFANKNVIALGLGCSASGPLVLVLQIAFGIGPQPTRTQQILLYESVAFVIVAGLWATASLLFRHWHAIEAHASKQDLTQPLLQHGDGADGPEQLGSADASAAAAAAAAAAEQGAGGVGSSSPRMVQLPTRSAAWPAPGTPGTPTSPLGGSTPQQQLLALGQEVWRQRSLPPLAQYSSLEPFQTGALLSADNELPAGTSFSWAGSQLLGSAAAEAVAAVDGAESLAERGAADGSSRGGSGGGSLRRQLSAPGAAVLGALNEEAGASKEPSAKEAAAEGAAPCAPPPCCTAASAAAAADTSGVETQPGSPEAPSGGGGGSPAWQAVRLIWAPLAALSLSSMIALICFPFFTFVPTSGLLGQSLPKVLFFVRIFSDVLGRFLPRLSLLAARSPLTPLLAAVLKLAGVPIFLVYLKSPDWLHSDVAAVLFVCFLWLLGGYINTAANMLAPRLVPAQLKSAAAGMMALAYQIAHIVGLALATLLVYLLYGQIGVE